MLVLVASTGAAVSIPCDAAASVGAVGDALASHPDVAVPRRDQLLIFDGKSLEGETRTLAEYGLPERAGDFSHFLESAASDARDGDARDGSSDAPGGTERVTRGTETTKHPPIEYVFLYRKSALSERAAAAAAAERPESPGPDARAVEIAPTPPPTRSDGSHPLERAAVRFFVDSETAETSARLHRLVAVERSLAHAAARVRARNAASSERLARAASLVRAAKARALAADAASASVETHLASHLAAHAEFMRRVNERVRRHASLLDRFEDDLETLRATRVISASNARRSLSSGEEEKDSSLLDLVDAPPGRLREKRDAFKEAHDGFVAKLHALDARVAELKRDVELLFMTAPDVDVEALQAELDSARDALRAQKSTVDEVLADAETARALVSRCVAALESGGVADEVFDGDDSAKRQKDASTPSNRASSRRVLLAANEVDALSSAEAAHASASFARVAATDDVLAAFHAHCVVCGLAMAANARARLREISKSQSAIGTLRDARAASEEIALRMEKPFADLLGATRALLARHAACLAESARRAAYADRFAARVRRAADLFAADEKEERDRREAFRRGALAEARPHAFAPALDAVTRATLAGSGPAPSVEITARGVPRAEDNYSYALGRADPDAPQASKSVDEELAAVFGESL